MNNKKIIKKIVKMIKKYDTIVIARHVGPDPDALASQIGLKEIILATYPNKKVYAVGLPASKFKYLGELDRFNESMYENSLLITLDVPDKGRVDGVDVDRFSYRIKIDHHPFIEEFCDLEWIEDNASSASQMVVELSFNSNLKMTKSAAEKLYLGIVADTNRFLFYYTTPKTFDLVSRLIKATGIKFTDLYEQLYLRPVREIRFQGYISQNLIVTPNGLGYINLTDDILQEYSVDASTAGNMVTNFGYIEEILVWVVFSYDKQNDNIRGSIRSRGPIINDIASRFGGGGHFHASGVRLRNEEEINQLVEALDKVCVEFKEKNKK